MAKRIWIDTDPGIDDAMTLLLTAASPEVELIGVSVVHGNIPLSSAVRNGLSMLELAGLGHVPLYAGAERPLLREPFFATYIHGNSGLGDAQLPEPQLRPMAGAAIDALIAAALERPGELTLIAIGPLTNVALALRKEPRLASALAEVIIMGGALRVPGNTTPLAEFNIYVDPHAAQIVCDSGVKLTVMPWDITKDVRISAADLAGPTARGGRIFRFLTDATAVSMAANVKRLNTASSAVNDPAALVLAFLPELAELVPINLQVETASELTIGATVADFRNMTGRPHNAQAAVAFDTPRFLALFFERMTALEQRLG
jgi:purine nucleosidase